MKARTKILLSLAGFFIAMFLPAVLMTFYVHVPSLVSGYLVAWFIYLLVIIWKLPKDQRLYANRYKDRVWGNGNVKDIYGLKSELQKLTEPNNFVSDYSDKVLKAIKLQERLKLLEPYDISGLKEVRIQAEQELGITLNTEAFCGHLLKVFSPANYLKDPDKVYELNQICSLFLNCKHDMDALENALISAQTRINTFNYPLPDFKGKITKIFFWGVCVAAIIWIVIGAI